MAIQAIVGPDKIFLDVILGWTKTANDIIILYST